MLILEKTWVPNEKRYRYIRAAGSIETQAYIYFVVVQVSYVYIDWRSIALRYL